MRFITRLVILSCLLVVSTVNAVETVPENQYRKYQRERLQDVAKSLELFGASVRPSTIGGVVIYSDYESLVKHLHEYERILVKNVPVDIYKKLKISIYHAPHLDITPVVNALMNGFVNINTIPNTTLCAEDNQKSCDAIQIHLL